MGEFNLNLSTRPFPAYQLKSISLTIALVALIVVSVWQASGFLYYSSLSSQIKSEARNAGVESQSLSKQVAELDAKLSQPEAKNKLKEIEFLNDIIVRKTFSWTRVFATLEDLMPPGAHLVSLRPSFQPDQSVLLTIDSQMHTMHDFEQLFVALQSSPLFDDVIAHNGEKETASTASTVSTAGSLGNDMRVSFTAKYHPEREEQ